MSHISYLIDPERFVIIIRMDADMQPDTFEMLPNESELQSAPDSNDAQQTAKLEFEAISEGLTDLLKREAEFLFQGQKDGQAAQFDPAKMDPKDVQARVSKNLELQNQKLKALTAIAVQICTYINNKQEPIQEIQFFYNTIDTHFQHILHMLNTPFQAMKDGEQQFDRFYYKMQFYSQILGSMLQCFLNENQVSSPEYMKLILKMFHLVLSRYLAADPIDVNLLNVCAQIFEWEKELHKSVIPCYVSNEVLHFDTIAATDRQRAFREKEWRLTEVKPGLQVDVIQSTKVDKENLRAWTRGTVVGVGFPSNDDQEEDNEEIDVEQVDRTQQEVCIRINNLSEDCQFIFPIMDEKFAPLGTYTQDYDWRQNLEVGDVLDAVDVEFDWYKSLVLKTRENEVNGQKVKQVYVGYRNYTEEGNKEDASGKFFGWTCKYDEWRDVHDIRIQKFGSVVYDYTKVDVKLHHSDWKQPDRGDILAQNKYPAYFAAGRDRFFSKSNVIIDALNQLGASNFFPRIIEMLNMISQGNYEASVSYLQVVTLFLKNTLPLWHRQVVATFAPKFNKAMLSALSYINMDIEMGVKDGKKIKGPLQADNFNYSPLQDLVNILLDPIWKRYYNAELNTRSLSDYQIQLGTALLKVSKLEMRIQGFRYIKQAINDVRQHHHNINAPRPRTTAALVKIAQELGIFELIYGQRTHFELVKKSQSLLKIMFTCDAIKEREVDMIWDVCMKQGRQMKMEVYAIIIDVLQSYHGNLTEPVKLCFIDKIKQIPPQSLIEKDIQLLYELGKRNVVNIRAPDDYQTKASNYMWSIAIREKDFPLEIIKPARKHFCEMTNCWDDQLKEDYIAMTLDNISSDKYPLQNIKILSKLVESFMDVTYINKRGRTEIAQDLIQTQDLINLIITDLEKYVDLANNAFNQPKELTLQNFKTYQISENHCFPHFQNIKSRLSRIFNLLSFAKAQLNGDQLLKLWDIIVVKSELKKVDQNEFFAWLKRMIASDKKIVSEQSLISLFKERIVSNDIRMFKNLQISGLDVIVRLFVLINELEGNVQDLEQQNDNSWNAYSQYGWNNSNYRQPSGYSNKFNRFRVHTLPQNLLGIQILWHMMKAVDPTNLALFMMVQRTLINIYTNLSSLLVAKTQEVSESFVKEVFDVFESIIANEFMQRTEQQLNNSINFTCKMLTNFFNSQEQNGIATMKPHSNLLEFESISKLNFDIRLPIRREIDASQIELTCNTNNTVWSIKRLVSQHIDASPLCITFKRYDSKMPQFKDSSNICLLSDLCLTDQEVIQVDRARTQDSVEVPLVDKRGEVAPELNSIFQEWFERFSKVRTHEDIVLDIRTQTDSEKEIEASIKVLQHYPDPLRTMTRVDCQDFVKSIAQVQDIKPDNYRISNLFDSYCKILGYDHLLEQEFLKFYEEQTKQKPETVKNNLMTFGIDKNLAPKLDTINFTYETDNRVVKDNKGLLRFQIANNEVLFEKLFELIQKIDASETENLQSSGSIAIWQLILSLPTNIGIFNNILDTNQLKDLLVGGNKDSKNIYKILYFIQIIRYLIHRSSENPSRIELTVDTIRSNKERQIDAILGQKTIGKLLTQINAEVPEDPEPDQQQQQELKPESYNDDFPGLDQIDTSAASTGGQGQGTQGGQGIQGGQGGQDQVLVSHGDSVPQAPPCAAAAVGAPNASNTQQAVPVTQKKEGNAKNLKFERVLDDDEFYNQVANSPLDDWLPHFVEGKGLSILIELFYNLLEETKKNSNSKVYQFTIIQVIWCISILMISQLKTQQTEEEKKFVNVADYMDLNRSAKAIKINTIAQSLRISDDEKLSKEFLQEFQFKLLELLMTLLEQDLQTNEDEEIILEIIELWARIIQLKPELVNDLIDENKHLDLLKKLLQHGLVSNKLSVREQVAKSIKFITWCIDGKVLIKRPIELVLSVMIEKMEAVTMSEKSERSTQYFQLIHDLMDVYLTVNTKQMVVTEQFLNDNLQRLTKYESKEKKRSFYQDQTLIGLMNLTSILIKHFSHLLDKQKIIDLIKLCIQRFLFAESETYSQNVTNQREMTEFDQSNSAKCLTMESQKACFNLLTQNIQILGKMLEPAEYLNILHDLFQNQWAKIVSMVGKPESYGHQPAQMCRNILNNFVGIKNLGAVCYMNSINQQFFNIPAFRYCLIAANNWSEPNIVRPQFEQYQGLEVDDRMLHQMTRMFATLELSDRQAFDPTSFCFSFKSFGDEPTNVREQRDANEYLLALFDRLENQLKVTPHKHLIQNIFGGLFEDSKTCGNCGHCRRSENPLLSISIEVKNQTSIQTALNKFIEPDIISGYTCDECKQTVELSKRTTIKQLPNTLILHLQRIGFDMDSLRNVKYNERLEFTETLSLKDYMTSNIKDKKKDIEMAKEAVEEEKVEEEQIPDAMPTIMKKTTSMMEDKEASDEDNNKKQEEQLNDEDFEYRLVGVVNHMGSADAGHYLSYVNVERDKRYKERNEELFSEQNKRLGSWLEFNDHIVKDFSPLDFESLCYGDINSNQSAYMLIYEKVLKRKMKIVMPRELFDKNGVPLASDGAGITREQQSKYLIFSLFPQILDNFAEQEFVFDEKENEVCILLNQEDVQMVIPQKVNEAVQQDNTRFRVEKLVYNESFFKATLELFKFYNETVGQVQQTPESRVQNVQAFALMDKILYNFLAYSNSLKQVKEFSEQVLQMLSTNPDAIEYLLKNRIFMDKALLEKNEKSFFEAVATHPNQEIREMSAKFLYKVTCSLNFIQHGEIIDQIFKNLFGQMINECAKHWLRLEEYFTLIFNLFKYSKQFAQLMLNEQIITKAVDLLQRFKPNQLYEQAIPPFDNLVNLIVVPALLFDQVQDPDMMAILPEGRNSGLKVDNFFEIEDDMTQLAIPQNCLKALFSYTKANKEMLFQIAKYRYSADYFSKFLAHLCYENEKFSTKVAKFILKGTNQGANDDSNIYLQVMKLFLSIDDSLKHKRLEWIFGLSYLIMKQSNYYMQNTIPKIGVDYADNVQTTVYKYYSPIYKSALSSNFYSRKDCALQSVLTNKNQQSRAVMNFLKCIFSAILDNKAYHILRYLIQMEPPTYQFARYWDFIKPWVMDDIEFGQRNSKIAIFQKDLALSMVVLSQIEEIEKLDESIVKLPKKLESVIEYPEDEDAEFTIKPYLIWELKEASIMNNRQEIEQYKISMFVNELTCAISRSLPTGKDNLALMDAFDSYGGNNNMDSWNNDNSSGNRGHNIRRRQFGRGGGQRGILQRQNRQGGAVDTADIASASGIPKPSRQYNYYANDQSRAAQRGSANDEDADSEDDGQDGYQNFDSPIGGKNVNFKDEEQGVYNASPISNNDDYQARMRDENITDLLNSNKDPNADLNVQLNEGNRGAAAAVVPMASQELEQMAQNDKGVGAAINLEDMDKDDSSVSATSNKEGGEMEREIDQNQFEVEEEEHKENSLQEEQMQVQDAPEDNYAQANTIDAKCLLSFKCDNNSHLRQTIRLTVKPSIGPDGKPYALNFRYPVSPIVCEIGANSQQIMLIVSKLDPYVEDWGMFEYFIEMVEPQQEMFQGYNQYDGYNQIGNNYQDNWDDQNMQGDTGGGSSATGSKDCPQCTFTNPATAFSCEMCGGTL